MKITIPMLVLALQISFAGLLFSADSVQTNLPPLDMELTQKEQVYKKMELLTEVLLQVKRNYVEDNEYGDIVDGAIHGMLQSLDPHSDYLDPRAYRDMKEDTRGEYGGVGVHIGVRNDILTVIAPIEDTPAFMAGMLAGDRIIAVDKKKTGKMKLSEAVDLIKGKVGTKVVLTVARAGEPEPLEFTLTRARIEVASVKGARIVRNGIGYVRITQFSATTADDLQNAIDELLAKEMHGLVLDLRSNPGGLVRAAVHVAEKFLPKGSLIVTTKGRKYKKGFLQQKAGGDKHYLEMPLVLLVNEGTASAAEIVSGALQDHGRAVLLGETTYGKGSVQSIIPLTSESGSAIRLTTARYYTPSGRMIHGHGIEPDILVYVPPSEWLSVQKHRAHLESPELYSEDVRKQYLRVRDRQLERAVDLVEALMVYDGVAEAERGK